jgi:hypothetical protein
MPRTNSSDDIFRLSLVFFRCPQVASHGSKLATQLSRAGVDLRIERDKQQPVFPQLGRYDVRTRMIGQVD